MEKGLSELDKNDLVLKLNSEKKNLYSHVNSFGNRNSALVDTSVERKIENTINDILKNIDDISKKDSYIRIYDDLILEEGKKNFRNILKSFLGKADSIISFSELNNNLIVYSKIEDKEEIINTKLYKIFLKELHGKKINEDEKKFKKYAINKGYLDKDEINNLIKVG